MQVMDCGYVILLFDALMQVMDCGYVILLFDAGYGLWLSEACGMSLGYILGPPLSPVH